MDKLLTKTIVLSLSPVLAAACASATSAPASARKSALAVELPEPRLITFESDASGFHTKTFFYDTGEEVVAIDAQFTGEHADKAIAFLRTRTQSPITWVIVTHPNPDKLNGVERFQREGAIAVGSTRTRDAIPGVHSYKRAFFVEMAKMFAPDAYPKEARLDRSFDSEMKLPLRNGEFIQLRELARAGVSGNQTVVLLPRLKTMIVGDLIHSRTHAWLEGGIVGGRPRSDLASWIETLGDLPNLVADAKEWRVAGGRGESAPLLDAVDSQVEYLRRADTLVSRYLRELGPRRAELNGARAGEHHAAIATLFEREFPGYAHPYLIQYGVYGLLMAK